LLSTKFPPQSITPGGPGLVLSSLKVSTFQRLYVEGVQVGGRLNAAKCLVYSDEDYGLTSPLPPCVTPPRPSAHTNP